ncbi:hypothetical protein LO763_25870 [Glycomyces sp. A-F 0318]|uniref:response regulator n=1 Tax=Glycomyces amatae TaxID=2881355 RepID=UPI001E4B1622|nr:hypothetical protein [Glycomyces amatae]MCD0447050.1 hypothetical protein [Glycomyces amatae]
MTSVLLVEDQALAGFSARALLEGHGMSVDYTEDPSSAVDMLRDGAYDVVVVDIHLRTPAQTYEPVKPLGTMQRIRHNFQVSGLKVLAESERLRKRPGRVVWSSGEADRKLQLAFAYQDLRVRCYCDKHPRQHHVSRPSQWELVHAIENAEQGAPFQSELASLFLPPMNERSYFSRLFEKPAWPEIWEALALGYRKKTEIAAVLGYAPRSIRNEIDEMLDTVQEINPGFHAATSARSNESGRRNQARFGPVAEYAAKNQAYFLDETVQILARERFNR